MFYNVYNYLSMSGWNLIYVRKNGSQSATIDEFTLNVTCGSLDQMRGQLYTGCSMAIMLNGSILSRTQCVEPRTCFLTSALIGQRYMTCFKHVTLKHGNVNFRQDFRLKFVPWICYSRFCCSYGKQNRAEVRKLLVWIKWEDSCTVAAAWSSC